MGKLVPDSPKTLYTPVVSGAYAKPGVREKAEVNQTLMGSMTKSKVPAATKEHTSSEGTTFKMVQSPVRAKGRMSLHSQTQLGTQQRMSR